MIRLISTLSFCGLLVLCNVCLAQQSKTFGNFEVHYNVLNSNLLPPQVAQGYGITRSASRALLNITVLDKAGGEPGTPVEAKVSGSTLNLTGQRRDLEIREIKEGDGAIYYISELPIANMETYGFTVDVQVEGEPKPFRLEFRQQFYTE